MYRDTDGWSQEEYNRKLTFLTHILRDLAADVWGFQELWHANSLQQVLTSAGMDTDYTALVPPDHTGQRIVCAGAVRSDILVGTPEWIKDFPAMLRLESSGDDQQAEDLAVSLGSFSRPVLHFEVKPRANGKSIHVYVCHFKSKRPTDIYREGWYREHTEVYKPHKEGIGAAISTIRRTAEAAALRWYLTERMKDTDTPVVVLGDFNDGQFSNTLNILTGQPNYILSGLDKGGADNDLYESQRLQQYRSLSSVYYTHVHQNTRESLDHILVSQEFYDNSRRRIWAFKGLDIWNDYLNHDNHKETGSTDHGVVRATFEYRPA